MHDVMVLLSKEKLLCLFHISDMAHAHLWLEASPYIGSGYKNGLAEGGHKTTDNQERMINKIGRSR